MGTEIGKLAVRRSILIEATPERVWKEFESFERMKLWYGTGHTLIKYEPHQGGMMETQVEHEGSTLRFGGRIIAFEPARELTAESDWYGHGWDAPALITIRLTPALGGTLVELFHHAIERTGEGAAEEHRGFESGWTLLQLEALRQLVEA